MDSWSLPMVCTHCAENLHGDAVSVLAQALWALYQASSLTQGLDSLLAVNASPSVLATYGALAGALYGYSALPSEWCQMLHRGSDIDMMAGDLCRLSLHHDPSPHAHSSHPPSLTNKGSSAAG